MYLKRRRAAPEKQKKLDMSKATSRSWPCHYVQAFRRVDTGLRHVGSRDTPLSRCIHMWFFQIVDAAFRVGFRTLRACIHILKLIEF